MFKFASGPINWESIKQRTAAVSRAETEHMTISANVEADNYLKRPANDTGSSHNRIRILNDHQAAKSLCEYLIACARTEHIDI